MPLVAAGLTFAPAVIAYWPRGYPKITGPTAERPALVPSLDAAGRNWLDSLVFSPRALLVLLPVAALGIMAIRSWFVRALLVLPVLINAAFYTGYAYTAEHPRFLYVSLPPVLVLWATGATSSSPSFAVRGRDPSPRHDIHSPLDGHHVSLGWHVNIVSPTSVETVATESDVKDQSQLVAATCPLRSDPG